MKFLLTFCLLLSLVNADHIRDTALSLGYQTDFIAALQKSKDEHKPLMMIVVSNYCPWCRKFESTTLQNSSIKNTIMKNFVPLLIDKESSQYPQGYNVPGVPSVFFIQASTQDTIGRSFGYKKSQEFISVLERASQSANN